MYILGISSYAHEASCALLKEGKILAMAEEERFNREKHSWKFPEGAIRFCLERAGIGVDDLASVGFFWDPWLELRGNLGHFLRYFPQSLGLLRGGSGSDDLRFLSRIRSMRAIGDELHAKFESRKKPRVHFVEHHLGHAASAFLVSPFQEAAILTVDGRGECSSTLIAKGRENHIEKIAEIPVPHSLGHLYASVTTHLGFRAFFDEWKVMGLSAYGTPALLSQFEPLVRIGKAGLYELDLRYFSFHTQGRDHWLSDRFREIFGPARAPDAPLEQRHYDLAFALQRTVEKAGVALARFAHQSTGSSRLCMTGGVALNCLMNKEIVAQSDFQEFFFQPVANDAGTALGAALYVHHQLGGGARTEEFLSPYWGPDFSEEQIERALQDSGVRYRRSDRIAAETAKHIAAGKIVGWFQGRMESGPRALGNRSIVVDPTRAEMKDILNARVKKRESFRPFAPSVLEERCADYFVMPKGQLSPFMILAGEVRAEKRSVIPAVTHADHTARVQTVSRKTNPSYWELISEFERLRGVPVLLNTSFNENEPIVCTPQEAIRCFQRTEFDVLAIGDFLVEKE